MTDYKSFNDDIDLLYDLNDERDRMSTLGMIVHVTTSLMILGILIVVLILIF